MKDSARKKSMSVFQDVYGINKEDPEQYFKHMSAVANYKNSGAIFCKTSFFCSVTPVFYFT
jgi:hypothetical protein